MVRDDYDSGRNRIGADKNGGNLPQQQYEGAEAPMATNGNQESMNLNNMLLVNVRTSDYFTLLAEVTTFEALVDQIYYDVQNAVPWVPGTHNKQATTGPPRNSLPPPPPPSAAYAPADGPAGFARRRYVRRCSRRERGWAVHFLLRPPFQVLHHAAYTDADQHTDQPQGLPGEAGAARAARATPCGARPYQPASRAWNVLRAPRSTSAWWGFCTCGTAASPPTYGSGTSSIWATKRRSMSKVRSTTTRPR